MNDVERLGTGPRRRTRASPSSATIIAGSRAAKACFARQYCGSRAGSRETLAERCDRLRPREAVRAMPGTICAS